MTDRKVHQEGFSMKEVGTILGVHPKTVRRWCREGTLEAIRTGPRLIRIPLSEIQRLRKQRVRAGHTYP